VAALAAAWLVTLGPPPGILGLLACSFSTDHAPTAPSRASAMSSVEAAAGFSMEDQSSLVRYLVSARAADAKPVNPRPLADPKTAE